MNQTIENLIIPVRKLRYKASGIPTFGRVIGAYDFIECCFYVMNKAEALKAQKNNYQACINTKHAQSKFVTKIDESEIYVSLTELCNFSCPGCATSTDLIKPGEANTFTKENLSRLLELYIKSCIEKGIKQINIKWAGGEPLLTHAYNLITQMQELINQYANNIKIRQTILTNGVFLSEEKIKFFKKLHAHVSVSLWGTKKTNEKVRRPRNKQESFDIIWHNIEALSKTNISFNVNYVYGLNNSTDFPNFLKLLLNRPKPIPLGIVFLRPQNETQYKILQENIEIFVKNFRRGLKILYDMAEKGELKQAFTKIDYFNIAEPQINTCGSGINYVAISPKGIANCHEALYGESIEIKNLKNNLIDLVSIKTRPTELKISDVNSVYQIHGGNGCPRDKKYGKSLAKEVYREILDEILSIELTRILNNNR